MAKKLKKVVKPIIIENPVHIRVEHPVTFRKQILTCALETAQLLKGYSEIKEMQEKRRLVLLQKLEKNMDSIAKMERKLENLFPKVKYANEKKEQPKHEIKPIVIQQPKVQAPKPEIKKIETETDKLQKELADIERKLAEL